MMGECGSQCTDCQCQEDTFLSEGEKARMRALSLYLIRTIVERHGGSVDVDLATDTINIEVPAEEMGACAKEIETQVNSIWE